MIWRFFLLVLLIAIPSHSLDAATPERITEPLLIRDAWAPSSAVDTGKFVPVYMTIINLDSEPDTLIAAKSPFAAQVMFQNHTLNALDSLRVRQHASHITIPELSVVQLRPQGKSLFMVESDALRREQPFHLMLQFARNGNIAVPVTIRAEHP